jgi:hypothetical protein
LIPTRSSAGETDHDRLLVETVQVAPKGVTLGTPDAIASVPSIRGRALGTIGITTYSIVHASQEPTS